MLALPWLLWLSLRLVWLQWVPRLLGVPWLLGMFVWLLGMFLRLLGVP